MCTAASFKNKNTYFGRTLDYEFSYGEKVTITPRNYPFEFRHLGLNNNHYAIIGMAHIHNDYPMYYDAMNEYGLGMAGLNFVGNAKYNEVIEGKENVAQFEFISFILSTCKNVLEAKNKIKEINLVKTPYNEYYPAAKLHWILRDTNDCIVVEAMEDGLHIYDNKTGTLTNNPPFNYQLENLKNYVSLNNDEPNKSFSFNEAFYSRGMGSVGLPGDLTSQGRFVRVVYTAHFSVASPDENSSVNQFFHILESVWQTRGLCKINDKYEITIYASCMNLNEGIYYYKTYDNPQISAVYLKNENLNSSKLISYDLAKESIFKQN
ncbi:MAG TPA: choloylglycine hydrolase [Acholeplasmatales bacterium]|nr:choloylglycine hydrolase [Acholeplasmatales bacterium]